MHVLSVVLRYYPYWAIPVALSLGELGIHFRRRKQSAQWAFFGVAGAMLALVIVWLVYRGDLNSDVWAKSVTG